MRKRRRTSLPAKAPAGDPGPCFPSPAAESPQFARGAPRGPGQDSASPVGARGSAPRGGGAGGPARIPQGPGGRTDGRDQGTRRAEGRGEAGR